MLVLLLFIIIREEAIDHISDAVFLVFVDVVTAAVVVGHIEDPPGRMPSCPERDIYTYRS